jgi:hypothetical protein
MSPQPTTGGSWSWTGPGGFTSTSRQITRTNIQTSQGGNYVATYTNASGCVSTATFSITVTTGGGNCSTTPQYVTSGGNYVAGSLVKNVGNQYECKPWPYSGWCNGAAWAYAPGTGTYWTDAWILKGSCTARMIMEDEGTEIFLETEGMLISPNPLSDTHTLTLTFDTKPGDVDVHLIQTNGLQVQSRHYENVEHTLDVNVPAMPQGLYVVKVKNSQKTWVKKVLIK